MCRFKSYVVTKDLKVHGSRRTSSHDEILRELNINESTEQNAILTREHVKIEVTPRNNDVKTRNLTDWIYSEDETGSLPEWYRKNKGRIEEAVFTQLTEDLKVQVAINTEEISVTDTEVYSFGSSQVKSYGSSQVYSYGSSQVYSYGSSQVYSYGSSQVKSYGSSQVYSYGSSQVKSYGSSQVYSYGSSQVYSYGSSQVYSFGSSQVYSYGSSQVKSYGSSQVYSYGSSQVKSYDSSQVEIKSETSTCLRYGVIYVLKTASVKKLASGKVPQQ